jgi:3-hydroxyacyl-CoA dehydrogenase
MRLLEVIPTPDTDLGALETIARFCDLRLGKGVVFAKDTPNFIANRIGTFSVLNILRIMQEMNLSIEQVDALTGSAVGWPRSATFRTLDMVGLDVFAHVVSNLQQSVRDESSQLSLPNFVLKMLEKQWLGDKSGGGFYKKSGRGDDAERLVLDWQTLEYRPRQKPSFPAVDMAKNIEDTGEKLRALLALNGSAGVQRSDPAAQFLWRSLTALWNYTANRLGEISDSVADVDRAMRLGFNWELGPFELWDAAGVQQTVSRMKQEGAPVSPNSERLLAAKKSWYAEAPSPSGRAYFELVSGDFRPEPLPAGVLLLSSAKKSRGVVKKNAGASLVDIGEGVGCIEFHSKMNAVGNDIVQLITQALKPGGAGENFDAFVITSDAQNFSVGANLMLLLMAIQEEDWDEVDLAVRAFQQMTQAIKFSPKPVVVAPFGMTLGGGCEISLHAPVRQAHAELYIGLVEVGVGLIPGAGGCKETLLRALESAEGVRPGGRGESVEFMEAMKHVFETIATAKVSTSASEARKLGFLRDADQITMNRERLLADAKERALDLARSGYHPPIPRSDIPAPGENVLAALKLGIHLMKEGQFISDYEVKIGNSLAAVLCGGNVSSGMLISEQYVLDLEREAFKSLCGEPKTQERLQYTLKTGKTLRN